MIHCNLLSFHFSPGNSAHTAGVYQQFGGVLEIALVFLVLIGSFFARRWAGRRAQWQTEG